MSDEHHQAIDERKQLIEDRAHALARQAVTCRAPWTRWFGSPPLGSDEQEEWLHALAIVAAYRDRYTITAKMPLGRVDSGAQRADRARALTAMLLATPASVGTRRGARLQESLRMATP